MSKIQEQIKALQLKQKKIEYISYVLDLISNDTKCIDFKEVQAEICQKIEPFFLSLIDQIETDTHDKPKETIELSQDEIKALKVIAQKMLAKPAAPAQEVPKESPYSQSTPPEVVKKPQELSLQDKMAFSLANRHLANRKVQVINDQNVQVFGSVVGLDAPHVHVKTDTGPTISVPLEKVVLL